MSLDHIIAGGISGIIEVSCTHPLDYIKIAIQQRKTIKIIEFYRGILPRYTSIFPMRGILWGTRNVGIKYFNKYSLIQQGSLIGTWAGIMQTFVDAPLENMKIQKIYYNKIQFNYKSLTRGYIPNMIRNIILCSGIITGSLCNDNVGLILGSFIGCILSQPFDYLKTIQQTEITANFKHLMNGWYFRAIITPLNMFIGYHIYSWLI